MLSSKPNRNYSPDSKNLGCFVKCKTERDDWLIHFDAHFIRNRAKTIYFMFCLINFIDCCKYLLTQSLMSKTHFRQVGSRSNKGPATSDCGSERSVQRRLSLLKSKDAERFSTLKPWLHEGYLQGYTRWCCLQTQVNASD